MTNLSEQQLARLPKWAQDEISRLSRNLDAARCELANALGNVETSIEVQPYRHTLAESNPHRTFLKPSATVRFAIEGGHLDVHMREGRFEVCALGLHGQQLAVRPWASNLITVEFAKDTWR